MDAYQLDWQQHSDNFSVYKVAHESKIISIDEPFWMIQQGLSLDFWDADLSINSARAMELDKFEAQYTLNIDA